MNFHQKTSARKKIKIKNISTARQGDQVFFLADGGAKNSTKLYRGGYLNSVTDFTPVSIFPDKTNFVEIHGKLEYSDSLLALDDNSIAWTWGDNYGGTNDDIVTVPVHTTFKQIYGNHSFKQLYIAGNPTNFRMGGIDIHGTAWCWGKNGASENVFGNLNIQLNEVVLTPVAVHGNHTFTRIASNTVNTIGLDNHGQIWSWGSGLYGLVGDGTTIAKQTPVKIYGSDTKYTFKQIAAGLETFIALDINNKTYTWGRNRAGGLGINSTTSRTTPVALYGNHTFTYIAGSNNYRMGSGLTSDGQAFTWGENVLGSLGIDNATAASRITPTAVATTRRFERLYLTNSGQYGIDERGRAWGWGSNTNNRLGLELIGNTIVAARPVEMATTQTFTEIKTGFFRSTNSIALNTSGQLWGWGFHNVPFNSTNSNIVFQQPVSALFDKTFTVISRGQPGDAYGIDPAGKLWAWNGLLEGGNVVNSAIALQGTSTPVAVFENWPPLSGQKFVDIKFVDWTTIALDVSGKIYGWGRNTRGELGNGKYRGSSTDDPLLFPNSNLGVYQSTPVAVLGNHTFTKIFTGYTSTVWANDHTGKTWAWGFNRLGQLGVGPPYDTGTGIAAYILSPVSMHNNMTFTKIRGAQEYTNSAYGTDALGNHWGWGVNAWFDGQQYRYVNLLNIASPLKVVTNTPIPLTNNHTFVEIYPGQKHTHAIDTSGNLWGWGINEGYALGVGDLQDRSIPTLVSDSIKFVKIYKDDIYQEFPVTFGLDISGNHWAWGTNTNGALGINIDPNVVAVPTRLFYDFTFDK